MTEIVICHQKNIEKIVDLYEEGMPDPKFNQIVQELDGHLEVRSKKLRHILDKAKSEKVKLKI